MHEAVDRIRDHAMAQFVPVALAPVGVLAEAVSVLLGVAPQGREQVEKLQRPSDKNSLLDENRLTRQALRVKGKETTRYSG